MPTFQWRPWESLGRPGGGPVGRRAAVATSHHGRVYVVVRGPDQRAYHRRWESGRWHPEAGWEDLGGAMSGKPGVVASGGHVHVIGRGTDGAVVHRRWDPATGWVPPLSRPWETIALESADEPVAISSQPGRVEVFAAGPDGALRYRWLEVDDGRWQPPSSSPMIGRSLHEPPTVVSWQPLRLDVFVRTDAGRMSHKWWDEAPDRFDVFVADPDPQRHHRWWHPGHGWLPSPAEKWEDLGGQLSSPPAVLAWGPHHLDVFARGRDGHLYHKWWDPETGWLPSITGPWEHLGGVLADTPAPVSWAVDALAVFVRAPDKTITYKSREPGLGWLPSLTGWYTLGETVPGFFSGQPSAVVVDDQRVAVLVPAVDGALYYTMGLHER